MIGVTGRSDAEYYLRTACSEHAAPGRSRSPAEYQLEAVENGEPAGQWMTRGHNPLGLTGEVDPEAFRTLVNDLRDPETGEALGKRPYRFATAAEKIETLRAQHPDATDEELATMRLAAQRQSKQAQHAYDVCFSAPKSWSVLWAALEQQGRTDEAGGVWEAIQAGVEAAMDYAARDLAYTRDQTGAPKVAGRATARYVHNDNWTMAAFRHHTSRDEDPQLHVHVCLLNRVRTPEGRWKTLYSPALTKSKKALDAVFLRVAEAELTRRTGFVFAATPDGSSREVRGVGPEIRDLFSTRTRAVSAEIDEMMAAFRAKYDRDPSPRILYHMNRAATVATRAPKPAQAPTREALLAQWETKLGEAMTSGLASVAREADAYRAEADRLAGDVG